MQQGNFKVRLAEDLTLENSFCYMWLNTNVIQIYVYSNFVRKLLTASFFFHSDFMDYYSSV